MAKYAVRLPKKQQEQDVRALRRAAKQHDLATAACPLHFITRTATYYARADVCVSSLGAAMAMAAMADGDSSGSGSGSGIGGSWGKSGRGATAAGGKIPSSVYVVRRWCVAACQWGLCT